MTDLPPKTHNNPPKTVFERIDDLYAEAKLWLDGEAIETDAQAEGLGKLMAMLAAAGKECEAERKAKVAPLDEARNKIQAEYTGFLGKAKMAIDAAKSARDKWLKAKQAVLDEQARLAREEADKARREALEAMQASIIDLAARERAEAIVEAARQADFKARALAKATPKTIGGRKTVTPTFKPTLVNGAVAANHYWRTRQADMQEYLIKLAVADVKAGKRDIPGFTVQEQE